MTASNRFREEKNKRQRKEEEQKAWSFCGGLLTTAKGEV